MGLHAQGPERITAIDQEGRAFQDDVGEGDLWNFPPASRTRSRDWRATAASSCSSSTTATSARISTFSVTDWLAHTPREVLAKNFGVPESAFANIPEKELYIFQAQVPGPLAADRVAGAGPVAVTYSHPTPLTNLAGFCLELFSGKGLESALLEGIGLKHETVSCHYGAVFPKTPMATRTVPWLHGVRLPPPGHLLNGHGDGHSVPSRSLVRCVSFSLPKSGNKPNKPHASMVAGKGFAGHCSPSS